MKKNHTTLSVEPTQKTSKRRRRLFFTGFSMGLADLVPGVSGGTVAFLFGIYDELLFSIKQATGRFPRLIIEKKLKEAWKALPVEFLLPVFLGILIAIFSLSKVVAYLLDNHTVLIWSFFFGLVVGSIFVVSKRVKEWDLSRFLLLALSSAGTYVIVGLSERQATVSPLSIFITGLIAFCAMILPGISGSLIMVVMGQYRNVLDAVSERNFAILFYLAAGGAIGLATFARLLSWLLKHYHGATVAVLIGMMIGSLRKVWPWQAGDSLAMPLLNTQTIFALALAVLGCILVIRLEKIGIAQEHQDIDNNEFKKEVKSQERL